MGAMNYVSIGINIGIVLIAVVFFYLTYIDLKKLTKIRNFFSQDEQPANLEEIINSISVKLKKLESYKESSLQTIGELQAQLNTAHQKISIHKYSAFAEVGGSLSFTLAVLDKNNDGYILTNIVGRDQSRIYCKQIHKGISEQQLTAEEQKTLAETIQK